jgi:hypothetical protein
MGPGGGGGGGPPTRENDWRVRALPRAWGKREDVECRDSDLELI